MKCRALSLIAICAIGATTWAQVPSCAPPDQPGSTSQQQTDTASAQPSARSFEGRIAKVRGQLVLVDRAAQTSYKLDDQVKAKKYEGQSVKVMATLDSHNSDLLHVIDITAAADSQ